MIELKIIIKFAKKKLCPSKIKKPFSIATNITVKKSFLKRIWEKSARFFFLIAVIRFFCKKKSRRLSSKRIIFLELSRLAIVNMLVSLIPHTYLYTTFFLFRDCLNILHRRNLD